MFELILFLQLPVSVPYAVYSSRVMFCCLQQWRRIVIALFLTIDKQRNSGGHKSLLHYIGPLW
jgi:hypothetical protein